MSLFFQRCVVYELIGHTSENFVVILGKATTILNVVLKIKVEIAPGKNSIDDV